MSRNKCHCSCGCNKCMGSMIGDDGEFDYCVCDCDCEQCCPELYEKE